MARGCSDSDSEEERHDRFKSERNPTSVPVLRTNIPSSLECYAPRARSPLRPATFKNGRHRSRHSEERKTSPHRRIRSRDRKSSRENDTRRSSSEEHKRKHRRKKSHEKKRTEDKYDSESKKRSKEREVISLENEKEIREKNHKHKSHRDRKRKSSEKDRKLDCVKRRKSREELLDSQTPEKTNFSDKSSSEKSRDSDSSVCIKSDNDENGVLSDVDCQKLPRYYEIVDECAIDSDLKSNSDERNSKKHKKPRDRSESHHDSKKKKKHRRKHEKRKSECDDSKVENPAMDDSAELTDIRNSSEFSETQINDKELVEGLIKDNHISDEQNKDSDCSKEEQKDVKRVSSEQEEGELSGSESEQYFGPALPPGKSTEKVYGPLRPSDVDLYGPALPPSLPATHEEEEVEEGGDVIGPLPAGQESLAQSALDARASVLKYHMDNKSSVDATTKREEWMIELPEVRGAQLGLGPRKFRANAAPDMSDRSSWTDTPQDKAKKQLMDPAEPPELDSKKLEIMEKNKEMELLAKKSEKKSKSLLEMHQKELKKKKKKDKDKKPERRPFSREIDLQTNKLDESQKRSIIKKAQLLDTRFSTGESKFL